MELGSVEQKSPAVDRVRRNRLQQANVVHDLTVALGCHSGASLDRVLARGRKVQALLSRYEGLVIAGLALRTAAVQAVAVERMRKEAAQRLRQAA